MTMTMLRWGLLPLFFLTAVAIVHAQSPGWTVTTIDGVRENLTLTQVSDDSLYYEKRGEVIGHLLHGAIALEDLVAVRRERVSGALVGASFGIVLGTVGYLAGDSDGNRHQWIQPNESLAVLGGLVAGVGAIVGAIVDPGDAVASFDGKNREERKAVLARIAMFDQL